MKNPFAQLTSLERRFLAVAALGVFIVVNYLVVWPRFSDWSKTTARLHLAEKNLKIFSDEIAQKASYETKLKSYEGEGATIPPEEQSTEFLRAVQSQAAQSAVTIIANSRLPQRTNDPFFLEQIQSVRVSAGEPQLVDFLYKLGTGSSLIRVRELSVSPDPPRMALSANIKLVASYQKKAPARPTAAAAPAAATNTVKTATPTAKKP
ncbi:MAG: hypothetical protein EPO07_12385 [Verrucomicrobia bacterium]|nr:MAG: hypothetical protein EPO07_12385 [Verrucomicrobiota bacterium]